MAASKLYILPAPLSATGDSLLMPQNFAAIIETLDAVIVESAKLARAHLKHYPLKMPLQVLPFYELNEHTTALELEQIVTKLVSGGIFGLFSDAGLACIADPGASLVKRAKAKGIEVRTLPGPCSITMALQLSGLVAQKFTFHSYLPKNVSLKALQARSQEEKSIQIFIETPYRNQVIFQELLECLHPETELCVALDLTGSGEWVSTKTIREWRTETAIQWPKVPAIFLFLR